MLLENNRNQFISKELLNIQSKLQKKQRLQLKLSSQENEQQDAHAMDPNAAQNPKRSVHHSTKKKKAL